ncbi:MAG: hypothetical protein LBQ84_00045, partial [Flavobacteriaceae bacterium]|nr:hypothetical protein [Flavobacteriaceae bacterium]
ATTDEKKKVYKTVTDKRKRKDFSIFRKLIYDRRLPALFEYYESDIIDYNTLRLELNDYNRSKEKLFKRVFDLEEEIIKVMSDDELTKILIKEKEKLNKKNKEVRNLPHNPYLDWLKSYNIINEEESIFLKKVRNKLSHNEFPLKEVIEQIISLDNNQTFSSQIIKKYLEIVDKIISEIKN